MNGFILNERFYYTLSYLHRHESNKPLLSPTYAKASAGLASSPAKLRSSVDGREGSGEGAFRSK